MQPKFKASGGTEKPPEAPPVPALGRIVHYMMPQYDGKPPTQYAAIITEVHAESVALFVMAPCYTQHYSAVPYDAARTAGTWHWPEKV